MVPFILKKKNVLKSFVDPLGAILVQFSIIFSIHLELKVSNNTIFANGSAVDYSALAQVLLVQVYPLPICANTAIIQIHGN